MLPLRVPAVFLPLGTVTSVSWLANVARLAPQRHMCVGGDGAGGNAGGGLQYAAVMQVVKPVHQHQHYLRGGADGVGEACMAAFV